MCTFKDKEDKIISKVTGQILNVYQSTLSNRPFKARYSRAEWNTKRKTENTKKSKNYI